MSEFPQITWSFPANAGETLIAGILIEVAAEVQL